jgi:hypothetical protein
MTHLEGAKSGIQEDCKKKLDRQNRLNEGGGHLIREQHVLVIGKHLLSHIKLLGPKQKNEILDANKFSFIFSMVVVAQKTSLLMRLLVIKGSEASQDVTICSL